MSQATFSATDYRGTGPENYERYFVPAIGAPVAAELVEAAALRPGEKVLDVACGTGVVTRLAAEKVGPEGSAAGLDVNPGMLSVARSVTPSELGIDWYETSAEAMPLSDDTYDVVLCSMGLQFVPNKNAALAEARRVLEPGGRAVLGLPGPTPPLMAVLAECLAKHVDPKCAGFVHAVFSLHEPDELRGLLSEAGFSSVEVERSHQTLRLPAPESFLWQYVHSTPLAGPVGAASEAQRAALQDEVIARWQEHSVDDGMEIRLGMSTVVGR